MDSPISAYQKMLKDGDISADPVQYLAVKKLQTLYTQLKNMGDGAQTPKNLWHYFSFKKSANPALRGLYFYGGAGRGKSLLMDIFFKTVPLSRKRRQHFHEFMLNIHDMLNDIRKRKQANKKNDIIKQVAKEIANDTILLCFDEFHISNITDAMILGRLFENLLAFNVVIVATSNNAPDDLYKGGLQRARFLPFIDLLKNEFDIFHFDNPTDYRLIHMQELQVYYFPLNKQTMDDFMQALTTLVGDKAPVLEILQYKRREMRVENSYQTVCLFDFNELCATALAAEDYLQLAKKYRVLFLKNVPIFKSNLRNEAKRFILLVDILYEHKMALFMTCAAPLHQLYQTDHHAFEFKRCLSRLMEMQSSDYLTHHLQNP